MPSVPALRGKINARKFRNLLLHWFDGEKRDLPWRGERDPYRILVSEIMLQQTRVAVVKERYKQFLRRFPTLTRLARAHEQTVLAQWSGLGYYRRARALHAAAKQIVRRRGFPSTVDALRELPGVGRYTAGAVASIAFGEPAAVVDGNVKRVLGRLAGRPLGDALCWQAAGKLLDRRRPGDFNQALMELGALVCLPGKPMCGRCPAAALCAFRGSERRPKPLSRQKAILNYELFRKNGSVFLCQRECSSLLMPGMWELPSVNTTELMSGAILTLRHSITTTDYVVQVFAGNGRPRKTGRWVVVRASEKLPLTGLARKILRSLAAGLIIDNAGP
ncbi:MAG TPA: A/G-specific adenine glycosylase [Terriglobales bacterium]